jgi:hypothetical protein
MERVLPLAMIVAFVVGWQVFFYKQSGGRILSWLWTAFGTTAAAVLYLVAGALGYILDRHDRFVAHSAWAGSVIWSEIGVGLLLALVAAFCWHRGLQKIRRESGANLRHA